jgi:hypothetical protein
MAFTSPETNLVAAENNERADILVPAGRRV